MRTRHRTRAFLAMLAIAAAMLVLTALARAL